MKMIPLTKSNPHLKDRSAREALNARAVRSSCGVEGIKPSSKPAIKVTNRREKSLYNKLRAKLSSE